ncbi:MAG: hypothetical protein P8X42_08870 [Calditrichaceae bacterium]
MNKNIININDFSAEDSKIISRLEYRKKQGADESEADWQASLEFMMALFSEKLNNNSGRIFPIILEEDKEWEFYIDLITKIDLPPDVYSLLCTPSFFTIFSDETINSDLQINNVLSVNSSFNLIISHRSNPEKIIQVTLPGLNSIGIDVYENGNHIIDYSYETIDKCLIDLSKIVWSIFKPKEKWSQDAIISYTENWFEKGNYYFRLKDIPIHSEYSYIHNPELIGLSDWDVVFKIIEKTIPKNYSTLEEAISETNELNQEDDDYQPITLNGIKSKKFPDVQQLFSRIIVSIDMNIDLVDEINSIRSSSPWNKYPKYKELFEKTARNIYKEITGDICPKNVTFE